MIINVSMFESEKVMSKAKKILNLLLFFNP